MDYQKILKKTCDENEFAKTLGIVVDEITPGYAKGHIDVQPKHLNPIGTVHGGCIYALADMVAGLASCSYGSFCTTVSGTLNYLKAGIDTKQIICEAKALRHGKHLSFYLVEVKDEQGHILDSGNFSFYDLDKPIIESEDK